MPVKLINQNERLKLEIDGSTFYYRRLKSIERNNIIKKHTRRGEVDFAAAAIEMISTCLLDWDNVYDGDKKVKFDKNLVDSFPEEVLIEIQKAIGANEGDEAIEKNS